MMWRTRFAPSPTGALHLGHGWSAILGHDVARAYGGEWLLRIEDIDGTRSRPEHVAGILADLEWLGLGWDGPVVYQSQRLALYDAALERLRALGLVYPCFCTRAEIAREVSASLSAPHGPDGPLYPGTCRGLSEAERRRRMAEEPHCWRLDVAAAIGTLSSAPPVIPAEGPGSTAQPSAGGAGGAGTDEPALVTPWMPDQVRHDGLGRNDPALPPTPFVIPAEGPGSTAQPGAGGAGGAGTDKPALVTPWMPDQVRHDSFAQTHLLWHDAFAGTVAADPSLHGDVVLARKDAPASYHLAVTVDDAAQGITHVIRGRDLFEATHVHRLLQALLGLPTPEYHHHALLTDAAGNRLAKRNGAPTLASLRARGMPGAELAQMLREGRLPIGFAFGKD